MNYLPFIEAAVPRSPRISGKEVEAVTFHLNSTAQISCNITGTPTPRNPIWKRNGKVFCSGGIYFNRIVHRLLIPLPRHAMVRIGIVGEGRV